MRRFSRSVSNLGNLKLRRRLRMSFRSPKKDGRRQGNQKKHNHGVGSNVDQMMDNLYSAVTNLTHKIPRPMKNVFNRMMANKNDSQPHQTRTNLSRKTTMPVPLSKIPSPTKKSPPLSAISSAISNIPTSTTGASTNRKNVQQQQINSISQKNIRLNYDRSSTMPMIETKNMAYVLPIGSLTSIYEKLYDCYCFFVHCSQHDRVCIMRSSSSPFIWLPCVVAQSIQKHSWVKSAKENAAWIFANESNNRYEYFKRNPFYTDIRLIEILRLQLPQTNRFITRLAFYVHIDPEQTSDRFSCCQATDRLDWLDLNIVRDGCVENLWGPELVKYCPALNMTPQMMPQKIEEFSSSQVFHFVSKDGTPKNIEESWLKSVKITENDVERLYYEFLEHCYPSYYMTSDSFRQCLFRLGLDLPDLNMDRLFIAFNYMKNGFLSFHELLLGLVALEQDTPHDEVRIKFVFRYYDTKQYGVLYEEDMKRMLRDLFIITFGEKKLRSDHLEQKTREAMELFKAQSIGRGTRTRQAITWRKFLTVIATHQFRGTSLLCRSKKSIFDHITKRITTQSANQSSKQEPALLRLVVQRKFQSEVCPSCRSKQYRLSPLRLLINQDGYYDRCEIIRPDINKMRLETSQRQTVWANIQRNHLIKPEYPANFFIRKIREFNQTKKYNTLGFMTNERERLYQMFQIMAEELEPMLQKEQRVKQLASPCYIIGDIHGNLEDLMSLELTIWKQFPASGVHYLFLGDYVDRGRWSIECALYLLSMKVLMPKMITLLRGNHEIREIQNKYTYRRELWQKYDQVYGQRFWDLTNRLFDRLPLSATIDDTIFCCHGGIPHQITRLNELEKRIPPVVMSPESDCSIAWEIMWSDPINQDHFMTIQNLYQIRNENLRQGYLPNTKRGTAFYFNERALDNFFAENRLTHMIRAHEVPKLGFMIHFGQKCVTVFSCSHYCGNDNECCVLFAHQEKLRVIRIDTTANQPATDQFQQQSIIR
ncbi:uncharacterized protein LOC113789988 [Dermatophagoides pteronyssinus]|uniref:Serine/threonine-protein phosphatase n=1 Tax=Dermatophagoides pteronyssinus TaxID=6956 RepID=A0ABQ8J3R2_DERPT|nr:hypothetical protein DERP_013300 [Dermatophagoides pteronyssinus]